MNATSAGIATMTTRRFALTLLFACACARVHADTAAPADDQAASPAGARPIEVESRGAHAVPSATAPAEAQHTASGLAYLVLTPGTGSDHPGAGAQITAHYVAWTASDLQRFDDSYARGEPIEFQAEHVIPGWGEAVALMVVGETLRVWIPEALAYQGKPGMPAGMLIFDIELLGFTPAR